MKIGKADIFMGKWVICHPASGLRAGAKNLKVSRDYSVQGATAALYSKIRALKRSYGRPSADFKPQWVKIRFAAKAQSQSSGHSIWWHFNRGAGLGLLGLADMAAKAGRLGFSHCH